MGKANPTMTRCIFVTALMAAAGAHAAEQDNADLAKQLSNPSPRRKTARVTLDCGFHDVSASREAMT
jgi:hypothetical protein